MYKEVITSKYNLSHLYENYITRIRKIANHSRYKYRMIVNCTKWSIFILMRSRDTQLVLLGRRSSYLLGMLTEHPLWARSSAPLYRPGQADLWEEGSTTKIRMQVKCGMNERYRKIWLRNSSSRDLPASYQIHVIYIYICILQSCIDPSLTQIKACRLFGVKPVSISTRVYC